MTSHIAFRTLIRQKFSISENVVVSQQICNPENIELLLKDKDTRKQISHAKPKKSWNNYVVFALSANIEQQNCIIR